MVVTERKIFVCSYRAGDRDMMLDIEAYDWDEAEAIVKGIRETLVVDGEVLERGEFSGSVQ